MVLFYFMWGLIVVYLNFISAKFATKRSKLLHDIPLPDLLHDTFPKIHKHVPDYLLLFCASLMIITVRIQRKPYDCFVLFRYDLFLFA